jgi:hypothetical protein
MKDFTTVRKPDLEFTIDEDVFYAVGDVPGGTVLDLAALADGTEGANKINAINEFLDNVLMPDSAELFAERLRDPSNPISFQQTISVFEWLLEEYMGGEEAERPTQGPSSSSGGRRTTGRSSTARVRSKASTPVEVLSDAL